MTRFGHFVKLASIYIMQGRSQHFTSNQVPDSHLIVATYLMLELVNPILHVHTVYFKASGCRVGILEFMVCTLV